MAKSIYVKKQTWVTEGVAGLTAVYKTEFSGNSTEKAMLIGELRAAGIKPKVDGDIITIEDCLKFQKTFPAQAGVDPNEPNWLERAEQGRAAAKRNGQRGGLDTW